MATDYDAPRLSGPDDLVEESLDQLETRKEPQSPDVDIDLDEADVMESFELPGADLSSEELMVKVVPKRSDEFTCTSCFLVHHRSRLAERTESRMICRDCAD
jgi:hypothetical protein